MNSFSHGFLFICGLCWLLCEVCVGASAGQWTPLWIFTAGLIIMFSFMGCWPASDRTINLVGPVFTILIAFGIGSYGFHSLGDGFVTGGVIRLLGALVLTSLAVISLLGQFQGEEEANGH